MNKAISDKQIQIIDFLIFENIPYTARVSGAKLCTMKVGGPVDIVVEYNEVDQLKKLLGFLKDSGFNYRVLGAGSNVIIPDLGLREIVLTPGKKLRFFNKLGEAKFQIGSAMSIMQLSRKVAELGYSGLEFASGIPAQIGGAIFMNAGAHGGEICEILDSVTWLDDHSELHVNSVNDLNFKYRNSGLPNSAIIIDAKFNLVPGKIEEIQKNTLHFLEQRKLRQPLQFPSSGSIFKNPDSQSAGSLIENLGLKGFRHGGAQISELHANWIINPERKASAFDVTSLIAFVQQKVQERHNILLHPEVQIWLG